MGSLVAEIAERVASSSAGARSELEIRGGLVSPGTLTLSTAEPTVVDGNKLGQIDFQAPAHDGTGDALLVAASIYAEADATFSSSVNQTELVFATGASEAAAEKMRLTSDGKLGIGIATPASLLDVRGTVQVGVDDTGHDVTFFGAAAGAKMLWDESENALFVRGATADHATTSAGRIVLQTNQAAVVDNDRIGQIDFQASGETGSDALLVSASIWAEAEDTFDASGNETALVFACGSSELAAEKMRLTNSGHLRPASTNAQDLGSASLQWRNIYTQDMHLNNTLREEGNIIDGTKGSWTIQEGESDLFIINQLTGDKYKFNLEKVE